MTDALGQNVKVDDIIALSSAYGFDKGVFVKQAGTVQYYPINKWQDQKMSTAQKPYKSYIYGSSSARRVIKIPLEMLSDEDQVTYGKIIKSIRGI